MKMPEVIRTETGLVLEKPALTDAEAVRESILFSRAELARWTLWFKPDYSVDDAREWIGQVEQGWEQGTLYDYLICTPRERTVLGVVTVNRIDKLNLVGNLGYWIRSDQAGKGIAPRAARALVDAAFDRAGLMRIEVVMAVDNLRSQMVAEKLGAQREATLKNRIRIPTGQTDGYLYSLFPEG